MRNQPIVESVQIKYKALCPLMSENLRRLWAGGEAVTIGRGGISAVSLATGLSRTTIYRGIKEIEEGEIDADKVRQPGAGRKPITESAPEVLKTLEALVNPETRGDPESPLKWTNKSTRNLADELKKRKFSVEYRTVGRLLRKLGYSLQGNRKTKEGTQHPDRDAQFKYINRQVVKFQKRRQPVISVDTKKKELIGDFANKGREWEPKGQPPEVRVHDFKDKELGKAIPYGVYDLTEHEGWVSVGIDHDTAHFATATIRRWWFSMGNKAYPKATELLITADSGGSNSSRSRLWKVALQELSDEIGLNITVCHFPPGTSKWNKIEHQMFCHISQNWRGRPLESLNVVVNLIGNTKTRAGLRIKAAIDKKSYETGITVTDEELAEVNIKRSKFHGDWNYTIIANK